jgi:oligopeptide transport system permease protein
VNLIVTDGASVERINTVRTAVEPLCSLIPLFIAIGMLSWLTISRIVRAQVQTVKKLEYVEAARSLGLGNVAILFRHILPNSIGPIVVYTTLTIPSVMLFEAVLSFLGMGVKPPNSSWGVLIEEGASRMFSNPMQLVFPSVFFSLTLLSLNFLGDGLRDALDPKSSKD